MHLRVKQLHCAFGLRQLHDSAAMVFDYAVRLVTVTLAPIAYQ